MRRVTAVLLAGLVCASCSSSPSAPRWPEGSCAAGQQCVQSATGDVCRTPCLPDAGAPCPAGESCTQRSVCCTGTGCTAALASVCCPASGC